MNRCFFYPTVLLVLFLSCDRLAEPEEMVAEQATLTQVTAGQDSLVLYASFAGTKTDIGENGLEVLWEEGDKIGVYAYNGEEISYYCYTLVSGAGTTEGVFTGEAFDGGLIGASHPYFSPRPDKKPSGEAGYSSFLFTLPSSAAYGDYESCDFKVATSLERDDEGNSHLTFSQKLTLLDFAVTFPEEMRDDRALNFQMSASAKLTGAFYMDIEDTLCDVEPTDDCFSTVETVFGGESGLAIPSDGVLRFRMVVLPTVRNDEKISFSLTTAGKVYTFWLRAAKDYLGGYRYNMSIDLGALKAAGRLAIQTNPDFFYKCKDLGIFDFHEQGFVIQQNPQWQCSWNSSAFRFQNWATKSVAVIGHPETMALDQTYDLSISTIGSVGATLPLTSTAKVIKIDAASGTCWLHDEANGLGYIILTK